MAEPLTWIFRMRDQVSGPARTARRSLGDFIQTMHSGLASVQLLTQGAAVMGRALASGIAPAISREKSLGAFTTLLGDAAEAQKMYAQAVKFAAETPFETRDVVESFQRLLTARFAKEDVPVALRIIGDAASMQEDSQQAVKSVTRALSQIRSKGRLQGEELMQLQEAVPLNSAALYEKLGALYDVNADKARKMQEAGQIDSQAATYAILEQLSEQFAGNMEQASKQVGGLLSTIASRPAEFLERLQDTKGYDSLRAALQAIANTFDPASERGRQLSEFINELGSGILERVAAGMETAATAALAMAEGFSVGFGSFDANLPDEERTKRFAENMHDMGNAAGQLSRLLLTVGGALGTVYDWMLRLGSWMGEHPWLNRLLLAAGGPVGIISGSLAPALAGATASIGAEGGVSGTTQGRLVAQRNLENYGVPVGRSLTDWEISSYRSMAGLGRRAGAESFLQGLGTVTPLSADRIESQPEQVAQQLGLPMMAAGGTVRSPTIALIGERGPETITPVSQSGGIGPITITIPVNVYGAGADVGRRIGEQVEPYIYAALERLAVQAGRI